MALLLVDDDALATVAAQTGHDVAPITDRALGEADVIVVREGWDQVRGWRAGGIRAGVVLVTQGSPPPDRARLEPLVLLRDPDRLLDVLPQLYEGRPAGRLRLPTGIVDLDRGRFEVPGAPAVALTTQECRLLGYLGSRSGRAISRDELQLQVWDHRRPLPTKAVHMAISRLRRKLEPDPEHPVVLRTVRHRGYRLVPAPSDEPDLVGRHDELDEAEEALRRGPLGVHGAPGVGKTALARVLADRAGRAVFVALTGVLELGSAARALATAAGRPIPTGAEPAEVIAGVYRQLAPCLVVWDDADEQLAVDALVEPRIAGLRVLITGRGARAGLPALPLHPLSVADAATLLARLAQERGLELPGPVLMELATELDRLPLALTLAATRLGRLGPEGLAALLHAGLASWCTDSALARAIQRAITDTTAEVRAALALLSHVPGPWLPDDLTATVGSAWHRALDAGLLTREGTAFVVPRAVRPPARAAARPDLQRLLDVFRPRAEQRLARLSGACSDDDTRALTSRLWLWEGCREAALTLADAEATCTLTVLLDHLLARHAPSAVRVHSLERALQPFGAHPASSPVWYRLGHAHAEEDRRQAEAAYRRAAAVAQCADDRVRAQLATARMLQWAQGTRAAREQLRDLDLSGTTPVTATYAAAGIAVLRDVAGELSFDESIPVLRSCVVELEAAGHLREAASVGIWLASRLRRTGRFDEALSAHEQVVRWSRTDIDPVGRAEAELLCLLARAPLTHDGDGLLTELDLIERRLRAVRPQRVFQAMTARGEVLAYLGRPSDARTCFEQVHAWAERHGWVSARASAALWLVDVELDTGHLDRAAAWCERAVEAAHAADDDHLRAHAQLSQDGVSRLRGDPRASAPLDVSALSPIGRHLALALEGSLEVLRAELDDVAGPYGDALRAELDGSPGPLPRLLDARRIARVLRAHHARQGPLRLVRSLPADR